jgi:murein L,D-transpeptidase YafK
MSANYLYVGGMLLMLLQSCEPDRVSSAKAEKMAGLQASLQLLGVDASMPFELFFRAFKNEKALEVWVKGHQDTIFQLFKTYPICQASGVLGPKLKQGDRQVPEGFYYINRFNPKSQFHLSLGLNYPNEADLVKADQTHPGGDIFIHGSCISIGCLAMTDDFIKEIYVLALMAKDAGQLKIPVHIFPTKLIPDNLGKIVDANPRLATFWNMLLPIFEHFEQKRQLPEIEVLPTGDYRLREEIS